ncbi:MAG TPA: DUF2911 domain-containing protein [Chitinophagaceae bacterium]
MHKIISFFILTTFLACNNQQGNHDHASGTSKDSTFDKSIVITATDTTVTDTVKRSLPAIATANINGKKLLIQYHSPAVRGRIIWGGLVAFDQVWVTGAHSATRFESPTEFIVGDKKLAAGKYAFFTIPGKDEWIVILNKNWDQHLADEYKQSDDAVRITVRPTTASHQERLMYSIDQTGEYKCAIEMRWEKIKIRVPVELTR